MNVQEIDRILSDYRARLAQSGTVVRIGPVAGPPDEAEAQPFRPDSKEVAEEVTLCTGVRRDSASLRPILHSIHALGRIAPFIAWALEEGRAGKDALLPTARLLEEETRRLAGEIERFIACLRVS